MTSKAIDRLIEGAPEAHREAMGEIRAMIEEALPHAEPTIQHGFAVYTVDGEWTAGFATRKKGVMLYLMKTAVLDRHAETLGALRTGRSCVAYKPSKTLDMPALRALSRKMLTEAARS